jgi:excisionase family DNA binding protein
MQLHQSTGDPGTAENIAPLTTLSGSEIMTVEETANFTRTSVSYWRKKIAANALPVLRLGTRTLLRKSDVLVYLESKVSASNADIQSRAKGIAATAMLRVPSVRRSLI